MNNLTKRLQLSVSVSAFAAACAAMTPQAAMAQGATGTDTVEQVVVTGTNIRGVAPVGSHVAAVTQEDIQAIAPVSISEVVNSLPVISQANTLPQNENSYAFFSPNIHHLSSSNGNSTLVVIDGMRMAGGGFQGLEADPNIIPTEALARVEVLADGGSAIYGSDAVAGVVNFITRKTYEGLEVNGQAGFGKGYNSQNLDMIWGTKWDGGGVYVAASYLFGSDIPQRDRPYLAMGDYRPVGGTDQNSYSCSPATIVVPGNTSVYLDATQTTTIPGSASTNVNSAPCNNSVYGDLVGASQRVGTMVRVTQNFFGGRLQINDSMYLNDLRTKKLSGPGTLTATVYGAGPQANPFFKAPAGAPTATSETVRWVDLNEVNQPTTTTGIDNLNNEFDASYDVTDTWHVTMNWELGKSISNTESFNGFCTTCAYLALNGTAQSNGSTTTSDVGGANVIATSIPLNSPAGTPYLTTNNALDLWNPTATNRTSPTVSNLVYTSQTGTTSFNAQNQLRLATDAALFDLGAGEIHGAIGAEYYTDHVTRDATGSNNTGSTGTGSTFSHQRLHRNVGSAFAELQVPLVSPDMNIPMVQKVSIDIAGRYDTFSDVGHTGNPKYAIDWTVFDGFKARANYSTSFVAPPLTSIGDPAFGYAQGVTGASADGSESNTPVANFPLAATVPGAICSAGTVNAGQSAALVGGKSPCQYVTLGQISGTSGDQGIARQLGGGADNVRPQTGINWTAGFDFTPDFIPGLDVSATFFHTAFKGEDNAAHWQQTTNAAPLFHFLQFYTPANGFPTGATQTIINAFGNVPQGAFLGTMPAGNVYYTWAHDQTNFLYLRVEGIDLDANYTYDAGDWGVFKVGDFLSLFTQFKEGYDGKSYFNILGESGFNGTISSENFDNRTSFGWAFQGFATDIAVNFTPSYRNWISTSVLPLVSDPLTGIPIGGGDKVNSWTTVDLNLAYNFTDGWLGGDQLYFHSRNIFDSKPPFYNGNAGGSGSNSSAFGYNTFNASPLGRTVSFGIRAKF